MRTPGRGTNVNSRGATDSCGSRSLSFGEAGEARERSRAAVGKCFGESMRILWLLLLVTFAAIAQTRALAPAPNNQFAGSNICESCHADVWMNFYKNPHYKSIASGKEPEAKTGCEGCHGPARKHVENLRRQRHHPARLFADDAEAGAGYLPDAAMRAIWKRPTSIAPNIPRTMWRARAATPSTIRRRRNTCWRRSRTHFATAATPPCRRSSPCLPSTA